VLIDDLRAVCLIHKFIDDTALSEILSKVDVSKLQQIIDEMVKWSVCNKIKVND